MAGTRARPRRIVALALSLLATGCAHTIPRNVVSDFFAKDFALPTPYQPVTARLGRKLARVQPNGSSAAFGDLGGAWAGGAKLDFRAAAGGAAGDLGGAVVVNDLAHAARDPAIPIEYQALELPLPIIGSDPNAGVTIGFMPVSLLREGERITDIFAPEITLNQIQGAGAKFRMLRSFIDTGKSTARLEVTAGSTIDGAHEYELIYAQRPIGPRDLLFFNARIRYSTDLATRFWGIGNKTKKKDETSFIFRRAEGIAALGISLPFAPLDFQVQEILSVNGVGPGRLQNVPSARATFPDVPGMRERETLLSHRFVLTLDTRNSKKVPMRGLLLEGVFEIGDSTLASDVAFQKWGITAVGLYSYLDDLLTTAIRFDARYVRGTHVPFYEQTRLGGKTTLRGFGDGRFIDDIGYVVSLEERLNLPGALNDFIHWATGFDAPTLTVLQFAAFVDAGRVFDENEVFKLRDTHVDVGGAARIVVPESEIVASLDVGIGAEGPAVFIGLDYPF